MVETNTKALFLVKNCPFHFCPVVTPVGFKILVVVIVHLQTFMNPLDLLDPVELLELSDLIDFIGPVDPCEGEGQVVMWGQKFLCNSV